MASQACAEYLTERNNTLQEASHLLCGRLACAARKRGPFLGEHKHREEGTSEEATGDLISELKPAIADAEILSKKI